MSLELWEVEAREEIRDVIARYNHLADRGRVDEVVTLFCEDGVLESRRDGGVRHVGRAAIAARLRRAQNLATAGGGAGERRVVRHHVSSILFDTVDVTHADVRSYFAVLTNGGLDHFGTYDDEFARVAGSWQISRRVVRRDWTRV